jgi:hypothetical protein
MECYTTASNSNGPINPAFEVISSKIITEPITGSDEHSVKVEVRIKKKRTTGYPFNIVGSFRY